MGVLTALASGFARFLGIVCEIARTALLALAFVGMRILRALLRMLRMRLLSLFAGPLRIVGEIAGTAALHTF